LTTLHTLLGVLGHQTFLAIATNTL